MKHFVAAVLAALVAGTSAQAAVTFTVTVDTSSQAGQAGYIDLQFGSGCLGASCSPVAQPAFATVSHFLTDGILDAFDPSDPNDLAIGTSGTLPGAVQFDNQTATPEDFSQGLTFGNSLSFAITLSGAAIDSPAGNGGNYNGTGFFFSFGNSDFSDYYFAQNSGPFGFLAGALHIQPDGSVLAVANPDGDDYTRPSGLSFTTITPMSAAVPEAAAWAMMLAGFGLMGAVMRRRSVTVGFA